MTQTLHVPTTAPVSAWAQTVMAHPQRWVILDTETTGTTDPEIIEIAVLDAAGQIVFASLWQPTQAVNPFARQKHRISDAMLAQAPQFQAGYAAFCAAVGDRALLAWNADFDRAMVAATCARYGVPMLPNPWRCVMQQYQQWVGPQGKSSLAAACRAAQVPLPTHRASADAMATLQVLRAMAGVPVRTEGQPA